MKRTLTTSLLATWLVAMTSLEANPGQKPQSGIATIAPNKSAVRPGETIRIAAAVVYDHDLRDRTPRVPLIGKVAHVEFTALGSKKKIQVNPSNGIATYTFQVPKTTVPSRSYTVSAIVLESAVVRASVQKSSVFRVQK